MIHGRDLILTAYPTSSISYLYPIAAAKSCEIGVDTDFIEVASPTEGSWREYRPTIHGWSASASCLVARMSDVNRLFDFQKNKYLLTLTFYDANLMTFYKGTAYIKSLKVTGSVGGLATMSVVFQTTGELQRIEPVNYRLEVPEAVVSDRDLVFNATGDGVTIIDSEDFNINIITIPLGYKKARVTIGGGIVALKATSAQVQTWLTNKNNSALNAAAIAFSSYNSSTSVVATGAKDVILIAVDEYVYEQNCEAGILVAQ